MKSFKNFINENNSLKKNIIAYHQSNDLEHMENCEFDIELSDENHLFGQAIYFSSTYNITHEFGKYMRKFKISLDNPLNMNKKLTINEANDLLKVFLKRYNLKIQYYNRDIQEDIYEFDFSDNYDSVQYGEFFLEVSDICNTLPNKYFRDFIQNYLKFNSFYHYCDYGTNFITKKGDYGYCYGIYNTDDIKYYPF